MKVGMMVRHHPWAESILAAGTFSRPTFALTAIRCATRYNQLATATLARMDRA
jgi:hypothetical protein